MVMMPIPLSETPEFTALLVLFEMLYACHARTTGLIKGQAKASSRLAVLRCHAFLHELEYAVLVALMPNLKEELEWLAKDIDFPAEGKARLQCDGWGGVLRSRFNAPSPGQTERFRDVYIGMKVLLVAARQQHVSGERYLQILEHGVL